MKTKSVKFNFIMNLILTASSFLFPLITFPYVSRVLLVEGNGIVSFVTSVMTYFMMFASLGIPTYGIRACAAVRNNKEKLSKTVQELLLINIFTTSIVSVFFIGSIFLVPQFAEQKTLFLINGISLVLNAIGVNWLYSALEQYSYITIRSLIFKIISIVLMFVFVKNADDYIIYGAILIIATGGSNVMNFINLRKFISFKHTGKYDFKQHMKPIFVFFGTSAAISIYTNLDVVMLRFIQDNIAVGYYNAGIKVKTVLISLVTSLGTVLLPRLSFYIEEKKIDEFKRLIVKAIGFVLLISLPIVIYFTMFAKEAILLLSGEAFLGAVLPMQLLMPTVMLIGLSNITGLQVLVPLKKENKLLISIVCGAVVDFILNIFFIKYWGASGAALSTLIAELIVLIVQCIYLRKDFISILKQIDILKIVIPTIIATAITFGVSFFVTGVFVKLLITAVVFFGVYGVLLLILKESFIMEYVIPLFQKLIKKVLKK
ncbi:MAG: flippase [Oscillospiraceae bacterium]